MKNLSIEEIKALCTEQELHILELYFTRVKQKDICSKLGIKRGQIDRLVKKYNLTRFRDRKNYYCKTINTEDAKFWYFVGLFASDGNLYNCSGTDIIQFTLDDKEALEDIKTILGFTGNIYKYFRSGKIRYYIKMSDNKLIETVRGIFKDSCYSKTFTLKFPTLDNQDKLKMFLRGFLDGDGSYTKSSNNKYFKIKLYCASKCFVSSLYLTLKSIVEKVCLYKESYIEIYSYKQVYKMFKYLYSIYPEIGIKRKTQRAMQHIKNYELEI